MGYLRTIAALALLLSSATGAEPREPLTVTRIGASESEILITTAAGTEEGADSDVDAFSRAVSNSLRSQQQSIQANCQALPAAQGPIAARWAWEARCHYKRY